MTNPYQTRAPPGALPPPPPASPPAEPSRLCLGKHKPCALAATPCALRKGAPFQKFNSRKRAKAASAPGVLGSNAIAFPT